MRKLTDKICLSNPSRIITFSFDDGMKEDLQVAEMLKKYKLPAVFYIPLNSWIYQNNEKVHELAKDFEIGGHGITHTILTRLTKQQRQVELEGCFQHLKAALGKKPRFYAYPRGYYDKEIAKDVKKAGFRFARTVKVLSTKKPNNKGDMEIETTIHAYPNRKEYTGKSWVGLAYKYFDQVMKEGGYFHLWGHGWEIERHSQWRKFDHVLSYISHKIYGKYY